MGLQGRVESGWGTCNQSASFGVTLGVQSVQLRISSKLWIPDKPENGKWCLLDRQFIYTFSFHLFLARHCMRPGDSRGKTYSSALDSLAIAPGGPSVGFEETSLAWSLASYLVKFGCPGKFKMPTLYLLWAPSQHSKGLTIGSGPPGCCPDLLPILPFTREATLLLPGYLPVSDLLSLGAELLTPHLLPIHSPSSFPSVQRQGNQTKNNETDKQTNTGAGIVWGHAKFP